MWLYIDYIYQRGLFTLKASMCSMQLETDDFPFPRFQRPFQALGLYILGLSIQVNDQLFQEDLHMHRVDLLFCEAQLLGKSNLLFSDARKCKITYKLSVNRMH